MDNFNSSNLGQRLCANKDLYVDTSTSKKQKQKDKQLKKKLKELKANRVQIIILFIVVLLAISFFIFALSKAMTKKNIQLTDDTILTTLDASKYSQEIKYMYDREGQKELFKKEMDRIQSMIGSYLVENMTINDNSLKSMLTDIRKELKKQVWSGILSDKSTYYVGEYTVDDDGNLKFKFKNKQIEPDWINDESVSRYIILN